MSMINTIKWLVSEVPQSVRTLFAVLMIAIVTLTSTTVFFYKKTAEQVENNTAKIEKIQQASNNYKDSVNKVIYELTFKDKTDAMQNLQDIIEQQKGLIEDQKKQNKKQEILKSKNNVLIKANYEKINTPK